MEELTGIVALFFRDDMFYPVQFHGKKPPELEAADHAVPNPGTRRVETVDGVVLWQETKQ